MEGRPHIIKKALSSFVVVSLIAYACVLYFMLFVGFGRGMVIMSEHMLDNYNYFNSMNLLPFKTIAEYISAILDGNMRGHGARNLFGNLFLFFPAGFYLPFFVQKSRKIRIYGIVMATVIVAVEIVQLATKSGSLDIDDFILNFAGALMGFIFFSRMPIRTLFKLRAW